MLENTPGANEGGGFFTAISDIDIEELNTLLFNMAIIEAVFGGLAAGKIGSRNICWWNKTHCNNDRNGSSCIYVNLKHLLKLNY